jgi:hypothetical protein
MSEPSYRALQPGMGSAPVPSRKGKGLATAAAATTGHTATAAATQAINCLRSAARHHAPEVIAEYPGPQQTPSERFGYSGMKYARPKGFEPPTF